MRNEGEIMSEEKQITKIYECIGLLSSMVNSGEAHTSKSKEVIADAKQVVATLESDLEYLNRWKTLIESAPEFEVQKIAVERFLKTDGMRPFLESFKTRIEELESENFAQSDLIEKLQSKNAILEDALNFYGIEYLEDGTTSFKPSTMDKWRKWRNETENAELRAENERHKNREANEKKAMDIIERASEYFGENPDFAVEFSNVKKENERLSAEVEKWKRLASGKAI